MNILPDTLKLVLASTSPRRRELLANIGAKVRIAAPIAVDESYPANLSPQEVPVYISRKKAEAYRNAFAANETLITADTVVVCGDAVLGKPATAHEAEKMLRTLSGKMHTVVSGVTLFTSSRSASFSETTKVYFAPLSDQEIHYYVENFMPLDKAGAYGIQEWIGYIGIEKIEGDYYNVMGLPLHKLYTHLKQLSAI